MTGSRGGGASRSPTTGVSFGTDGFQPPLWRCSACATGIVDRASRILASRIAPAHPPVTMTHQREKGSSFCGSNGWVAGITREARADSVRTDQHLLAKALERAADSVCSLPRLR